MTWEHYRTHVAEFEIPLGLLSKVLDLPHTTRILSGYTYTHPDGFRLRLRIHDTELLPEGFTNEFPIEQVECRIHNDPDTGRRTWEYVPK